MTRSIKLYWNCVRIDSARTGGVDVTCLERAVARRDDVLEEHVA